MNSKLVGLSKEEAFDTIFANRYEFGEKLYNVVITDTIFSFAYYYEGREKGQFRAIFVNDNQKTVSIIHEKYNMTISIFDNKVTVLSGTDENGKIDINGYILKYVDKLYDDLIKFLSLQ